MGVFITHIPLYLLFHIEYRIVVLLVLYREKALKYKGFSMKQGYGTSTNPASWLVASVPLFTEHISFRRLDFFLNCW